MGNKEQLIKVQHGVAESSIGTIDMQTLHLPPSDPKLVTLYAPWYPSRKSMCVKEQEILAITRCTEFWLSAGDNRGDQQET